MMNIKNIGKLWCIALTFIVLPLTGCEGPMGPAGPAGIQGEKGDKGDPGASFLVWKGELAAAPANPEPYWAYFNTTIGNAYIYTGTAWDLLSKHGTDGVSIIWKGEGTNHPGGAQLNWAYYNSVDKKSYIYDGTTWQVLAKDGEVGPQGEPGSVTIVPDDGIDRISVTGPSKTGYTQGGVFSSAGLTVTARYTDNSVVTVSSGYALSWNDQPLNEGNTAITNTLGDKTVTVDWRGKTETFTVTVSDANSFLITNTTQWNNALSLIRDGGNNKDYTLTINGDIGVDGVTSANNGTAGLGSVSSLSITLKGSGKLYLTSQGSILRVNTNQTLYIDSAELTLEGLKNGQNNAVQDNNASVLEVIGTNAKLELKDGIISGNTSSNSGGGVSVTMYGNFTMLGGVIHSNTAYNGGGVYAFLGNFRIVTGTVYGSNASPTTLRNIATNSGAALNASSENAQRGTFSGTDGAWVSAESLTTTNNTIKVENGQYVP